MNHLLATTLNYNLWSWIELYPSPLPQIICSSPTLKYLRNVTHAETVFNRGN
jgi:hypothetical protein